MPPTPFRVDARILLPLTAALIVAGVLWLRGPSFGFKVWNVDEAVHAAVARTLLDGGILYRDAIDIRAPLSYYAVAVIFAVAGENNIYAIHVSTALLIAATAFLLFLIGRAWHRPGLGSWAAALYAILSTSLFYQGDANALSTEWFVAFFTTAAAATFWHGRFPAGNYRLLATGSLLGLAFLSKQPALLDLAAPMLTLGYLALRPAHHPRSLLRQLLLLFAGWGIPVVLVVVYFAIQGALTDFIFYTWIYNLTYYGPEISQTDRLNSLFVPFLLLSATAPGVLVVWLGSTGVILYRLLQRQPTAVEEITNPAGVFLLAWGLSSLAGGVSSGRGFDHYFIQMLPPLAISAGGGLAWLGALARTQGIHRLLRGLATIACLYVAAALLVGGWQARQRTLPNDPSLRAAAYVQAHTKPTDAIFVWGFHPEIYLHADRPPASRYVYASFITGLIPWTNTAPDHDTRYAIVPGTLETLIDELTQRRPAFIIDCSAGPNRHWDKYPLEDFPPLKSFIERHYRAVESNQFVPQGFRLFRLRGDGEPDVASTVHPEALSAATAATLTLPVFSTRLAPQNASAPFGASQQMHDGRWELFAHAPASFRYPLPAGPHRIRGGFGFRPAAYGEENASPTDGAIFSIVLVDANGASETLWQRHLRPHDSADDRGIQSFVVDVPERPRGLLELRISPGPADNPASDWTFWSDLLLEASSQ